MAGDDWKDEPLAGLCVYLNRGVAPAYTDAEGVLVLNQKCVRDQRVDFTAARRTDPEKKPIAADRIVRPFDILVNSTGAGTLGRVAQVRDLPEQATIDSHVTLLRPDPSVVDPLYLGIAVRSFESEIEALGEGSTGQTELPRARLAAFTVPVPTRRDEQRAIADIIGTLDRKIELNRRMSQTLDATARALFKSWFLDFDPVRARAEGRESGLPEPVGGLFPARLVSSELGEIPDGWGVNTLGDHYEAVKGVSYKGSGLGDDGMPLHNLNSVREGGGYKYEGIKYYSGDYAGRHIVRPGDVIVANTEQGHDRLLIGYAAMVPALFGDQGIASHHIYRVRPRQQSPLTASYLCFLLNSPQMHDFVSGYANGTTVNMLPLDGVQKPAIVRPPEELITRFDSVAVHAVGRQEEITSESRTLAALRDAVLPKLVSGELRVRDAQRFMASAPV